jgi:hypothetical protein
MASRWIERLNRLTRELEEGEPVIRIIIPDWLRKIEKPAEQQSAPASPTPAAPKPTEEPDA